MESVGNDRTTAVTHRRQGTLTAHWLGMYEEMFPSICETIAVDELYKGNTPKAVTAAVMEVQTNSKIVQQPQLKQTTTK